RTTAKPSFDVASVDAVRPRSSIGGLRGGLFYWSTPGVGGRPALDPAAAASALLPLLALCSASSFPALCPAFARRLPCVASFRAPSAPPPRVAVPVRPPRAPQHEGVMGPAQAADSEPGPPAGGEKPRGEDALHAVSANARFRRRVLHRAADAISRSLGLREREAPSSSDDGEDVGGGGGSPPRPAGAAAAAQPPLLYSTVLDFGCGAGDLSRLLAPRFEKIVGVDVCPARVDRFNESVRNQGIPASEMSAQCLDVLSRPDALLALGSFDCAYSCQVYHHLADPVAVTAALRGSVREGGAILAVDLCKSRSSAAEPGRRCAARDGDTGAGFLCPDCGGHHAGEEVHHRGKRQIRGQQKEKLNLWEFLRFAVFFSCLTFHRSLLQAALTRTPFLQYSVPRG
ncbi:MAG: S-adenosyl-L-methionine-dependent methyltransferase, partial [Olpidium bornovanus]